MNKKDKKILTGLSFTSPAPVNEAFFRKSFIDASGTAYSGFKRLMQKGFIITTSEGYDLDDPFFNQWIRMRRMRDTLPTHG